MSEFETSQLDVLFTLQFQDIISISMNNYAYVVSTYQFESSNESPIISHYKRKIIPSYLPLLFNFRGLTFQDFAEALAL